MKIRSQFYHLWSLILYGLFLPLIGHYIMVFKLGGYTRETAILVGSIFFMIFIAPLMILHLNHYLFSLGNCFSYDEQQGLMVYGKGGTVTRFGVKDVESIVCYKSWPLAENRTPIFPWDLYNYVAVKLKDGNLIKVSSLVVYEFEKKIKIDGIEMKIKKSFYPWIR